MSGVSEESYRLIVETIPGLVAVMTPAGELEHVNGQVLDYFGRTLDELKHWGTLTPCTRAIEVERWPPGKKPSRPSSRFHSMDAWLLISSAGIAILAASAALFRISTAACLVLLVFAPAITVVVYEIRGYRRAATVDD